MPTSIPSSRCTQGLNRTCPEDTLISAKNMNDRKETTHKPLLPSAGLSMAFERSDCTYRIVFARFDCKLLQKEKLLTVVQSCSRFRGTAKFIVKYSLMRVTYLRFLDALFGTVYWWEMWLTLLCSQFSFSNYWMSRNLFDRWFHADTVFM